MSARHTTRTQVRAWTLAAAALLLCLTGCTGNEAGAHGDPVASQSDAPEPTPEQQAVLSAYREYWIAFAEAAKDPSSFDSAALAEHVMDPELGTATQTLADWVNEGTSMRVAYSHSRTAATVNDTDAVVQDCLVVSGDAVDTSTGEATSRESPRPFSVTAQLTLASGAWKISSISDGEQSCAPSPVHDPGKE